MRSMKRKSLSTSRYEALEEAARAWREANAAARVGHRFKAGDKVLLSTQHLRLKDSEHRKTFPKFVGPFRVVRLGGHGNVETVARVLTSKSSISVAALLRTRPEFTVARGHGGTSQYTTRKGSTPVELCLAEL